MHWSVIARVLADSVNASPSANGLPGAGFVQRLIDWTAQASPPASWAPAPRSKRSCSVNPLT